MALTKAQKTAQLSDLKEAFKKASSVMYSQYSGLTVSEVSELRRKLRAANAEMKVAKKTLMQIAAKENGLPEFEDKKLTGPVAVILSYADPLTGAQVAFKFAKDHPKVALIGGVFEGKILSKEQAIAFAKMPGREQLLGMFMMMLRSPLSTFASLCSSPLQGFARSLGELVKKGGVPAKQ